ncbi:ABC transporter ATP-binding protein [Salinarchaeum chitinilyticum]
MPAIELDGVSKAFGNVVALRDVDLTVERGEVFGFLGPNGAGKSTTIDLLIDYARPTHGEVSVLGHDAQREPVTVRQKTGILPEGYRPMRETTGREHVEFAIDARDADADPDEILERVGLTGEGHREATGYSKGMAQRLALGMALVDDPELLILDEPSTGLDPHGVRRMREIVQDAADRGATVFFSSHILEQVEAVADRVGILRDGELITVNSIEGLRQSVGAQAQLSITLDRPADGAVESVRALEGITVVGVTDATITVSCPDARKVEVLDAVRRDGASVVDFETKERSLEDLFVATTGEAA